MIDGKHVFYGVECAPNGCNWYRIKQPCLKIMNMKDFPFYCAPTSALESKDHEPWLLRADAVITQGATSEKFLEFMLQEKGRKKFILDYDDNIFAVSPFNPSYERHGIKEVDIDMPDGSKIEIRDGKNGFDIKENRKRLLIFQECLKNADLVTTPSPILSGMFKRINRNVKVIKNFIDFNIWRPLKIEKDEFVRIGYQGGWSHFEDFLEIKDVLIEIMEKHKNVIFVMMGQTYPGALSEFPQDRVQIEDWANVEVYPWKFRALNIDIGIAPLKNTEFNTCKSEIKWEEYSSLEIPTVASNNPPYSLAIADGQTGFLCVDRKDWAQNLSALVESRGLRQEIGRNARVEVFENYNLENKIEDYINAYTSVFKRELILV